MAYQVGSGCYESALAASQAVAAAHVPVAAPDMVVTVSAVAESSISFLYTPIGSGVPPFTVTQALTLQPCNMLSAQDALDVGWLIGGAWLSIYAVAFLIRYLRGETEDINAGNA
jgi:hypothetical protein